MWVLCGHSTQLDTHLWSVNGKGFTKIMHTNKSCYNETGLCSQNIDTSLGSIVNTNGRAYVTIYNFEEKDKLHNFCLLQFLHLNV
jgi:hypothetical protein